MQIKSEHFLENGVVRLKPGLHPLPSPQGNKARPTDDIPPLNEAGRCKTALCSGDIRRFMFGALQYWAENIHYS